MAILKKGLRGVWNISPHGWGLERVDPNFNLFFILAHFDPFWVGTYLILDDLQNFFDIFFDSRAEFHIRITIVPKFLAHLNPFFGAHTLSWVTSIQNLTSDFCSKSQKSLLLKINDFLYKLQVWPARLTIYITQCIVSYTTTISKKKAASLLHTSSKGCIRSKLEEMETFPAALYRDKTTFNNLPATFVSSFIRYAFN